MKNPLVGISAALVLAANMSSAEAQARLFAPTYQKRVVVKQQVVVRPAPVRNLTVRTIGSAVDVLPANHVRVVHAGRTYFFHNGNYYLREGARYLVVRPLAGIRVTSLPRGYTTVRINGNLRYRYNDVLYRRSGNYFIVV